MANKVESFKASHLLEFQPRVEGSPVVKDPLRLWRIASHYEVNGTGYTLRNANGEVIACAGVCIDPPGVGLVWLIGSPLITQYPLAVYKGVRIHMENIIRWFRLRRLHTLVSDGFPVSETWLVRLGFKYEATLEKSGPEGEDQHVYVRMTNGR
jgi:hypothetical protein